MPVLILAESEDVDIVRPLAARLLQDGGEVRCYLDEDDYELRNIGCKLAVGLPDDEMNLEGALTNVHTFIPLIPDPIRLSDEAALERLVAFGLSAARAAASAETSQTIVPVPAVVGTPNPVGQALARIEREFMTAVHPLAVLRIGLLWGPDRPLLACLRGLRGQEAGGFSAGPPVGVVKLEEFVALVAAADERENLEGAWELGGEAYSVAELVGMAGEGSSAEPPDWFMKILAVGLLAGSSATQEFGVWSGRSGPPRRAASGEPS